MNKIAPKVLILHGDTVFTGTGRVVDAPPGGPAGQVLGRLSAVLRDNGQVLLTDDPAWDYLTDPDIRGDWTVTGGPGWHTARRGNSRLRIGKIPAITPGNNPLLDGETDLISIAVRHQMFADLLGVPFYGDGGTVFNTLLDQAAERVRGREPLRKWEGCPRVHEDGWPGGSGWPAPRNNPRGPLVVDRNAQYLAGLSGVYVPLDAPERTGPVPFDATRAGLWEVTIPDNPEPRLPHPCGVKAIPGRRAWHAHPTVQLLVQLGVQVQVHASLTLPRERSRRVLDPVASVLSRARAGLLDQDDPDTVALLASVKDVWTRGISHLDKSGKRQWYRPDWKAVYYSSGRTRMWSSLKTAGDSSGLWPIAVETDTVTYGSSAAGAALRIGRGVGEWKVKS